MTRGRGGSGAEVSVNPHVAGSCDFLKHVQNRDFR